MIIHAHNCSLDRGYMQNLCFSHLITMFYITKTLGSQGVLVPTS